MSDKRFSVFPTRMTLAAYKQKLKGATRGHSLLKKKSDALTIRFRQILGQIISQKEAMGDLMKTAAFSLAHAKRDAGDFGHTVVENVKTAQFKVRLAQDNIAGVRLPMFHASHQSEALVQDLTGLAKGGQRVSVCRVAFSKALDALVSLASLQTAFITLDAVIRITNRRVNALEYVVIPKVEGTIHYIESELDEYDREEFFRLKKVQRNKKKVMERMQVEAKQRLDAQAAEATAAATVVAANATKPVPRQPASVTAPPRSLIEVKDEETDLFT